MTCKTTEQQLEKTIELLHILGVWTDIAFLKPAPGKQQAQKAWALWEAMQHYGDIIWDMFENEFLDFCINTTPVDKKSTDNTETGALSTIQPYNESTVISP